MASAQQFWQPQKSDIVESIGDAFFSSKDTADTAVERLKQANSLILDLDHTFTNENWKLLHDAITDSPHLTSFILDTRGTTAFATYGAAELAKALSSCKNLTLLGLQNSNLDAEELTKFAQHFKSPTLTILDLSGNYMLGTESQQSALGMAMLLTQNPSLNTINVPNCGINATFVTLWLQKCSLSGITKLNLSDNALDDQALTALTDNLEHIPPRATIEINLTPLSSGRWENLCKKTGLKEPTLPDTNPSPRDDDDEETTAIMVTPRRPKITELAMQKLAFLESQGLIKVDFGQELSTAYNEMLAQTKKPPICTI